MAKEIIIKAWESPTEFKYNSFKHLLRKQYKDKKENSRLS